MSLGNGGYWAILVTPQTSGGQSPPSAPMDPTLLVILERKCTQVSHVEYALRALLRLGKAGQTDRWTDGRQTVTLRLGR